ncbi:MAG: hypothetical protein U0872_04925 [Planctomycetaceae bacterium]
MRTDSKYPVLAPLIAGELKDGFQAQAVPPMRPMRTLMVDVLGNIRNLLLVLTGLIIIVSGIGIFVSIYNRWRPENGKSPSCGGARCVRRGTVFDHPGGVDHSLRRRRNFGTDSGPRTRLCRRTACRGDRLLIDPWRFEPLELTLFPALFLLASLVGFLPGLTAYRTDVADGLSS